tara:strand:+ start:35534 stop:36049 length:516 start_codon:yes stop_codon:yes gene_type:complete
MKQLIYSVDNSNLDDIISLAKSRTDNTQFLLINSPTLVIKNFFKLLKRFKLSVVLLKLLIKVISGRNQIYAVIYSGKITSEGLISTGVCNHYKVNKNDCIIGPVNTDTNYQGKGFATFGLNSCLQHLLNNTSCQKVYIDTREDNFAMQKVIVKSGFNKAESSYERNPSKQL